MRIAICLLVYWLWNASAEKDQELRRTLSRLREENPELSVLGSRLFSLRQESQINMPQFSQEQLQLWRFMFRFANLQDHMPVKKLIDGASVPDMNGIVNLNFQDVLQNIRSDPDSQRQFAAKVSDYAERQRKRQGRGPSSSAKGKEDMSEEDLYAECAKDYDAFVAPITNPLANSMLPDCDNTTTEYCLHEPLPSVPQIPRGRRLIDAMFKIPEAIIEGKLYWIGSFEYCHDTHIEYVYNMSGDPEDREFDGQYTRLDLTSYAMMERNLSLSLLAGICTPTTCTEQHIYRYIAHDNPLLSHLLDNVLSMNITYVYLTRDVDLATDSRIHTMFAIMLLILILIVLSTVYDGFFRMKRMGQEIQNLEETMKNDRKGKMIFPAGAASKTSATGYVLQPDKEDDETKVLPKYPLTWSQRAESAFVGFSLYSNWSRIFTIKDHPDHIRVLDGIRVISYFWLMLGETALLGVIYTEVWTTANLFSCLLRWPRLWYFQIIITFLLSVDSFLYISGFLMVYWWLRKLEDHKFTVKFAIGYLAHKFWTLWTPLAFTMMLYVTAAPYSSEGPLLPPKIGDATNCYDTWWSTLLMVNNFVNTGKPCMTWTTHCAILMQIHVAAMVILLTITWRPKLGYLLLFATFLAHLISTAVITSDSYRSGGWYNDFFLAPWCRAGPYLIGMAVGIFVFHYKYRNPNMKADWLVMWAGTGLSIAGMFGVIFATHDWFKEGGNGLWEKSAMVSYHVFSHNMMGVGLGWITVACIMGHGGIINSLLSLSLFQPLSKLVYQAMLLHSSFIFTWVFARMSLLYLQLYHLLYIAWGHFWTTLKVGLIFSSTCYYPITKGLERALFCNDVIHWIQHGRHPKQLLTELKKAFKQDTEIKYTSDMKTLKSTPLD